MLIRTRLVSTALPQWMRLRLLIAMPFAALLGVVLGMAMARHHGGSFAAYASAVAMAGLALVWVGGALEHLAMAQLASAREAVQRIVPPVVDATLAGTVAAGLAAWLDANLFAAVTAGSAFFALYTAIVRKLLLGEAVESVFGWLTAGRGTPAPRQYSMAEALAAQGLIDAALAELERGAAEESANPEPLIRGARMLRDAGRHADAIAWLRRARGRVPDRGPQDAMLTREIVEVIRYRTDRPAAAAPELARMMDRHRGTPEGDWAERALHEVRRTL